MSPIRLGRSGSGFLRFFELVEGKLERAETNRFDFLDVNLIFAALFVDTDGSAHRDLQAVFGAELDAALLLFEENAADLSAIVFESEIDVAGLGFAAIGDLALNENVGEIPGEEVTEAASKFADRQDLTRGLEVEGELAQAAAPSPRFCVIADSKRFSARVKAVE